MPFPLLALGATALATALRPRNRAPSLAGARQRFLAANPTAVLSKEDIATGERYRGAGTEAIGQGALEARGRAARTLAARGIYGAPVVQAGADIEQGAEQARVGLNRDVSNLLEGSRQRTLDFERNRLFTAFGAETGDIASQRALYGQQSAGFWNSAIPLIGQLAQLKFPAKALVPDVNDPGYGWAGDVFQK